MVELGSWVTALVKYCIEAVLSPLEISHVGYDMHFHCPLWSAKSGNGGP